MPIAGAVSFGVDGQPTVYEDNGRLCFGVQRYVYSHSVISFLNWSRDIDSRDVRLLDLSVGTGGSDWSVKHEAAPVSGMRLRGATRICYGDAPAGFVTTDEPDPLVAGRYSILMNARDEEGSLRFYRQFCLAGEGRLVDCEQEKKPPASFLEQFFGWVFG